jgi:hypothetical protein
LTCILFVSVRNNLAMINMEHIEASTNNLRNGQHSKPTKQKADK